MNEARAEGKKKGHCHGPRMRPRGARGCSWIKKFLPRERERTTVPERARPGREGSGLLLLERFQKISGGADKTCGKKGGTFPADRGRGKIHPPGE